MSNFKIFISDVYDVNDENYKLMMKIINNPNPLNEKYTERHHIIPRFVYKDASLEVNNSAENVVELSIKNHILVHYYAAKCCFSKYRWKCLNAVLRTLGNIKLSDFENRLDEISNEIADTKRMLRETPKSDEERQKCSWDHFRFNELERKEKFGKQAKGNTYRRGTNLSMDTKMKISKNRSGKSLGHVVTDETKQKIGNANRGRKYGFVQETRDEVGEFNHRRLAMLKTKFTGETIYDWNKFQQTVKTIQEAIVTEFQNKTSLSKKKIRNKYKEEILTELLRRL